MKIKHFGCQKKAFVVCSKSDCRRVAPPAHVQWCAEVARASIAESEKVVVADGTSLLLTAYTCLHEIRVQPVHLSQKPFQRWGLVLIGSLSVHTVIVPEFRWRIK